MNTLITNHVIRIAQAIYNVPKDDQPQLLAILLRSFAADLIKTSWGVPKEKLLQTLQGD